LAFGPDGTWLVTGCLADDRLRIWDVATAQVRKEIRYAGRNLFFVTVSPDGCRVAATACDPKGQKCYLTVWDIASSSVLLSTEGSALAYSPDGQWLAALAADEKTALVLDARTHEIVCRLAGHEKSVTKAVFSRDSRLLATCSLDQTIRVWRAEGDGWRVAGQQGAGKTKTMESSRQAKPPPVTYHTPSSTVLYGHTDEVYAVAFHPDGTRLATGGHDGTVWLWDLAQDKELVRLPGHRSYVWSLAFSPDGATLASGSGDGTVRLWDTAPLKARYQARRAAAALQSEAERLVESLWRERHEPAAVVETVQANPQLSIDQRHAAIRAVLRRYSLPKNASDSPLDRP
jgi:WD40 repeat protein